MKFLLLQIAIKVSVISYCIAEVGPLYIKKIAQLSISGHFKRLGMGRKALHDGKYLSTISEQVSD